MKFTIEINGMRVYAFHGVTAQERKVGNMFEVTVHADYAVDGCDAVTDELSDTVNYADIAAIINSEMTVASNLLEHVADRIRKALCSRFPTVTGGMVRVAKLTPPLGVQVSSAAVTLRW